MSHSDLGQLDPLVAKALESYDAHRDLGALQDAGDQAARHNGEIVADRSEAYALGSERLANWLSIFSRFKRDLDPNFNPNDPIEMQVVPPGPEGRQYMPGVDPKDVTDPDLRQRYIAAIKENRERAKNIGFLLRFERMHRQMLEEATRSLAEAYSTLGYPTHEIVAALQKADILPSDRAVFLAALATKPQEGGK